MNGQRKTPGLATGRFDIRCPRLPATALAQLAYCFGALVIDGDGDAGAVDDPSDDALLLAELLTDATLAGLLSMRRQ
jgi:hypothetical protein